jgi:hypothetical protein
MVEEVFHARGETLRPERKIFGHAEQLDGFPITPADGAGGFHRNEAVVMGIKALMKIELIAQADLLPRQRVLGGEDEVMAGIVPVCALSGVVIELIARLDEVPPLAK